MVASSAPSFRDTLKETLCFIVKNKRDLLLITQIPLILLVIIASFLYVNLFKNIADSKVVFDAPIGSKAHEAALNSLLMQNYSDHFILSIVALLICFFMFSAIYSYALGAVPKGAPLISLYMPAKRHFHLLVQLVKIILIMVVLLIGFSVIIAFVAGMLGAVLAGNQQAIQLTALLSGLAMGIFSLYVWAKLSVALPATQIDGLSYKLRDAWRDTKRQKRTERIFKLYIFEMIAMTLLSLPIGWLLLSIQYGDLFWFDFSNHSVNQLFLGQGILVLMQQYVATGEMPAIATNYLYHMLASFLGYGLVLLFYTISAVFTSKIYLEIRAEKAEAKAEGPAA